jgi:hypothetical protein
VTRSATRRAAAFFAALALGCTGREAEALPIIPLPDDLAPPADALEARLRERGPTDAPLLVPDGPAFRATLGAGESRTFTAVLRAGVCYKVLGGADASVTDLDVLVYDPNNVLMQRDTTTERELVLGSERGICPTEVGMWRFELGVAAGEGAVIAQLWRMPF